MKIVSLGKDNSLVWYGFLKLELQKHIAEDVKKHGRLIRDSEFSTAWEISDDSSIAKLLSTVDDVVDRGGMPAINWINSKSYPKLLKEIVSLEPSSLPKMNKLPENSEHVLIKSGSGEFREIMENTTIKILFKHRSYNEAEKFAINYLKQRGPNRRVHITSCRMESITAPYQLYVVWIKK